MGRIAVTCISDGRLRNLCLVILRHLGYRVREAATADDAASIATSEHADVLVTGTERDDEQLKHLCSENGIKCISVAPSERIESLLVLLERRTAPRS